MALHRGGNGFVKRKYNPDTSTSLQFSLQSFNLFLRSMTGQSSAYPFMLPSFFTHSTAKIPLPVERCFMFAQDDLNLGIIIKKTKQWQQEDFIEKETIK